MTRDRKSTGRAFRLAWRPLGRAVGLACLALLAITACGGGGTQGNTGGSRQSPAASGGTLTVGWAQPPDTLNPATTGARDMGPIDETMFDTLVYLTKSNQPTPDLATKWTASADGLQYTFTLRHGVKFQDGTPFDASAVVANLQYIANPATKSTIALGLLGPCTTATADGQYQVTVHCSKAYSPLVAQLGEPYLGMQSPTAIKQYGPDLGDHPVGTGPFEFVSYTPNVSLTLQRNPAYEWAPPAIGHNGPAKLQKLVFQVVTDNQARVSELQSGQSQMIDKTPGVFFKTLGASGGFRGITIPISGMGYFAPINTSAWPTSDLAVRQAIQYAVNKPAMIKIADDGAYPPGWGVLQKGTPGFVDYQGKYPFNTQKAQQVLSAGGWTRSGGGWTKDGKPLALTITTEGSGGDGAALAQAIQGDLQQIGMKVSIVQQGLPAWLASNLQGTFNLTALQYVAVDPDALHFWFLPGQYYNWSHYTNAQLTNLIQQGQVESNTAKRMQLYKQAQDIVMAQALELPLRENDALDLVSNQVSGLSYSGGGFEQFYQVSV
ncbi:MAG: ABC transporter substrate-binding protein [Candidatus Dormiibacterota bacterium]